ncbi:lysine biosynthesis protein LysX [Candidatus Microgenomates bacterium]|nr:MAG: lysine biosynthesis protein LysX [Candidatus Microgenomates bacterium]
MLHTTIRGDEKLLMEAAKKADVDLVVVDARGLVLSPDVWQEKCDVVLERCVSTTIGMHAIAFFESLNIPVVNNLRVANICEDKFATSLALNKAHVPTIPFALAFDEVHAVQAIEGLGGYPVVLKPTGGSWGRLIAKINDQDALEAVIEQKMILGSPMHKALYFQKYIEKPGRDIRVTMVNGKVVCAIYREATHWVTNTARGAEAKPCPVDKDLEKISQAASRAVGGGVLGVDVFETDDGYVINEINHTVEFKNVQRVTGVDVAGEIISYCQEVLS